MFKTKTKVEYPEPPKPPSWDSMTDDLKQAAKTDVLFMLWSKNKKNYEFPSFNQKDDKEKPMDNEKLFNQALCFIQQSDKLEEDLFILEEKRENLKEISERLRESVEKVKKQASLAISKN